MPVVIACLILLLGVTFVVDFSLYRGFHSSKHLFFIAGASLIFSGSFTWWLWKKKKTISVSVLEILILLRIIWLIAGNPDLLLISVGLELYLLVSLLLCSLLIRNSNTQNYNSSIQPHLINVFLTGIFLFAILQALLGIGQFIWEPVGEAQNIKTAVIGTIGPPNGYGTYLACGILAGVVLLLLKKTTFARGLIVIALGIIITALIMNGSRGASLALVSALGFLFWIYFIMNQGRFLHNNISAFKKNTGKIVALASVICAILLLLGVLYQLNPQSSEGRLLIWKISAPLITEQPLTGLGHGSFGYHYAEQQADFFQDPNYAHIKSKAAPLHQPHNEYLNAFIESGVPGGILFLVIWVIAIGGTLRHLFRNNWSPELAGLSGLLMIVAFHAVIDDPLHVLPVALITYFCFGLVPLPTWKIPLNRSLQSVTAIAIAVISIAILLEMTDRYSGYRHWQQGQIAAQQYNWHKAENYYETALNKLPGNGELLYHYGATMTFTGRSDTAIDYMEQATKLIRDRNLYLSLSNAWMDKNNYLKAGVYAEKARRMFPDHLGPHLLLGEIYYELGKYEASQKSLLRCIHRHTSVQSDEVKQIAEEARELWNRLYKGSG